MRVSCFGSGQNLPESLYEEMKLAGRLLAERRIEIATGAFGGIGMQAAPEGAAQAANPAVVTGYTYAGKPPNAFITKVVDCRQLTRLIPFDAGYGVRLAGLLSSDAFIIAGGGGPGTFLELIAAINFNQKFWDPMKRIAILELRPGNDAWDLSMLSQLQRWGVLSAEVAPSIRVVNSAQRAVRWVCDGDDS